DIWENRLLDPKAAAGIAEGAMAQLGARYLERKRHHRMQGERPHEIGTDVVSLLRRQVLGDDDAGFDRRTGVARVAHRQLDPARSARERRFRIAVAEIPVADDIGANGLMQHRGVIPYRLLDIDYRR